ncbi:MAG: hypothetical protein K8F52_16285 [Candidatus Scalindua rubra]|uniref:Lipoprotein n=1 Tax=Candidatus Scalindua brodae TaxID=237368 RepID=A0A0B0EDU5_9BACT|nr:MAG: hypothetical protein SCABRO_03948 [Candidatus Scalindua brodae]MBZ0110210.1 hypothetical protein [Candidatus Scalindua rubra]TWU29028.1 hypothetical protein S225a_26660 [Candidatus Brocadiaceae bacterium S225]
MKIHKYVLIHFLLLLSSVGCTSTNFARISINEHPPKSESVVIPISSGGSDLIYERIGAIFVFGKNTLSKEMINKRMRNQAVKVGADAIIFARYKDIESAEYFESYGSAFVNFDWAKKQGTGNWLMKGKPVGAGLAVIYKTSQSNINNFNINEEEN